MLHNKSALVDTLCDQDTHTIPANTASYTYPVHNYSPFNLTPSTSSFGRRRRRLV